MYQTNSREDTQSISLKLLPIVTPATEAEKARLVSDLPADYAEIARKMAYEIDRLKSAIDGKDGWKETVGTLKKERDLADSVCHALMHRMSLLHPSEQSRAAQKALEEQLTTWRNYRRE